MVMIRVFEAFMDKSVNICGGDDVIFPSCSISKKVSPSVVVASYPLHPNRCSGSRAVPLAGGALLLPHLSCSLFLISPPMLLFLCLA